MSRMRRLAARGKRSRKSKTLGEPDVVNREEYGAMELDSRLELIRSLIPLGLMAVYEELEREVVRLAGARHSRKPEGAKHYHGTDPGTVRLAGQRVPIEVPTCP